MALVGHISGSSQSNSIIGISGSVIVANRPNASFPTMPGSDVGMYIHEKALFGTSGLISSGNISIVDGSGTQAFNVGTSGNLTIAGGLGVVGSSNFSDGVTFNGNISGKGTNNQIDSLSVTGSSGLAIARTLIVQQSITGSSTLTLAGQAILNGGVNTTTISATNVTATVGLSGSLTKLSNGTSYLVASSPITITTSSNGSVTIGSTAATMNGGNGLNNNVITADGTGGLIAEGNLNFDGTHLGISGTLGSTSLTVISGVLYQGNGIIQQDNAFVWDADNDRLGIGTASPARSLHIGPAAGATFRIGPNSSYIEIGQANSAIYRWSAGGTATTIEQNINHIFQSSNTLGFQSTNGQPSDIGFGRSAAGILSISGSAPGAILRFNATSTPLAVGDLGMNTTSGRPTAFIGGTSRTLAHTDEVALLAGATFTGVTNHNAGLSGSLTRLTDGTSYLIAGTNIGITTSSNGSVTITNNVVPGGSNTYVQFNDGNTFGGNSGLVYDKTTQSLTVAGGVTGSTGYFINNLVVVGTASIGLLETRNQTSLNVGDKHIVILTGSTDHATLEGSGILFGSGAVGPTVDEFGSNAHLVYRSIEDKLEVFPGLITSGTIKSNELSGSLTKLYDGTSYLIAGSGITISTGSNGAVTITGQLGDITNVIAGTGLTGGGVSGDITLNINDSVVATVSGTTFTGATKHALGLSGSLTQLTDGTSYLIAGSGILIASQSNGPITISSTGGSPGGSNTFVQFNDGGVFGGNSGLTYNKSTLTLSADTLSVTGSNGLSVLRSANISQSITGSSTLTLAGQAILNGGIIADGGAFQVADTTGNISTAGTLSVLQSITGSSTLTLSGQAILNGGIIADGGAFQVADNTGNISTAGTLNVLQSITGSSTLTLAGQAILNGGIIADGGAFQVADATGNISTAGTLNVLQSITGSSTLTIQGATLLNGNVTLGDAAGDTLYFSGSIGTDVLPSVDNIYNLGSASKRWLNIYTGDLHLRNDRGDYTLIEEEDMLTIRFNKTGKRYKFLLEAVPHLDEDPSLKF